MLLCSQNPLLGWQRPQDYICYHFRQANAKTPSKIHYNLIFGKDKLLMKNLNLIRLHMTHLSSIYCIMSITRPGCRASWQALCSRRQPGPSPAQNRPSRPVVPTPGLRTDYMGITWASLKCRFWVPTPDGLNLNVGGSILGIYFNKHPKVSLGNTGAWPSKDWYMKLDFLRNFHVSVVPVSFGLFGQSWWPHVKCQIHLLSKNPMLTAPPCFHSPPQPPLLEALFSIKLLSLSLSLSSNKY